MGALRRFFLGAGAKPVAACAEAAFDASLQMRTLGVSPYIKKLGRSYASIPDFLNPDAAVPTVAVLKITIACSENGMGTALVPILNAPPVVINTTPSIVSV